MPKGVPNKRYTPEFKVMVVETMRREGLSYRETERQFELPIYLTEGPEGLVAECRGQANVASGTLKGRPVKLNKQIKEDLIAENQRLRTENA